MENGRIRIHFSFYVFVFLVVYFNSFSLFISYFLALFLHEYSHYLLSKKYNNMSQTINIYPFGMDLSVNNFSQNSLVNFCIFLIGPLINILLFLIIISLWWYYPVVYFYTKDFVYANFCLGFFNIIPIYPLDGGNMILQLLSSYKSKVRALKVMRIFAICMSVFFFCLFIFSCFYSINFSCICIAFFLFSSIFSYGKILDNEIVNKINNRDNVKEYRAYVVNYKTSYDNVKKCFDDQKFIHFYIVNNSNKVIKILTQEEISQLYVNGRHFNK